MLYEVKMRNRDIKKCYRNIVKKYKKTGKMPSISKLINKTITSNAPGYYLTYDYARRLLSSHRRNLLPKTYRKLRRDMIVEIAKKVDRLLLQSPTMTEGEALTIVLTNGNASRFFISNASACRLINH